VITEQTLSVSGALLTKAFGRQEPQLDRFREESDRMSRLQIRSEVLNRFLSLGMQSFYRLAPFALYLGAGLMIAGKTGGMTPGTIVAFLGIQARLTSSMQILGDVAVSMNTSFAYFERIFEYLDLVPDIGDRPGARELPRSQVQGRLEMKDVWFTYASPAEADPDAPDGPRWALQGIDLTVEPGQMAAIVGPSGAGKTTLSYLIARLYEPTRGEVLVDDADVRDIRLASLAAAIGLITQETYVLHASVRENLTCARQDASDDELRLAASAALLHERIMEFPDAYESVLGDRGYRLSGG
jgi:ATP-binding cassette subfamily B protein